MLDLISRNLITQSLKDELLNTVRLPDSFDNGVGITLPEPIAGYVLAWNGSLDGLINVIPGGSISTSVATDPFAGGVIPNGSNVQEALQYVVNSLITKEAAFSAGTTAQYLRGDKTWQALTKAVVGLSNVDNTSDANKPISTATQVALDSKANLTLATPSVNGLLSATDKTKLDSVASGATANATDAALRDRSSHTGTQAISTITNLQTILDGKAGTAIATITTSGLLSAVDKTKIDSVASGATANDTDANLKNRANHTGTQTIATVSGLQTSLDSKEPSILVGLTSQYFRGDKTWQILDKSVVGLSNVDNTSDLAKPISTATQTALNAKASTAVVTTTVSGLMSFGDKVKLDGIASGATANATDSALRDRSTHTGTQTADTITETTTVKMLTATERTKLSGIATGATANDTDANLKNRANHTGTQAISTITSLQTTLDLKATLAAPALTGNATLDGSLIESRAFRGVANGYAPLGADGKIPSINLPENGSYKGNWDASTNTPTITAGSGTNGDTYTVSVAGTQSITGSSVAFAVGDQIRFTTNGSKWERIPNTQAVSSVAGLTGTISYTDLKAALSFVKADVGLTNVDNTSDANKPVSTAQQTALNLKANLASPTFTGTVSGITKSMVGLANVDNTSDANKPVSTATQTALDGKASTATATTTVNGLLAFADKVKLDGIATGATANATDANLRDRTTHTGTQAISTIVNLQTSLDAKEDSIVAGTTAQYWRGDKTWQALTKSTIGLANVDNTSDADKPVSTATASAISSSAATLQPLNANLTSIAALTTTSFGRSFLTLADAAASRTLLALGTSATVNTGTSGAVIPLLSTANTWGGAQTVSHASSASILQIQSITGQESSLRFRTGTSERWRLAKNQTTEGGSNAGSDLALTRYDDSGTILGTTFTIGRSTGNISFEGSLWPATDNTKSLGFSGNRWSNVYTAILTTSNAVITGGTITGITDIAIADGGTGASDATGARSNLGLGNVDNTSDANKPVSTATASAISASAATLQPLNSNLTSIASLTTTSFGRSFLTQADAAASRTLIGLGTAAVANTGTTGGTIPFLNGVNFWGGSQSFATQTIVDSTNAVGFVVSRNSSANNSSIEVKTTAGSVFLGNKDGTTLAVKGNNNLLSGTNWLELTSTMTTVVGLTTANAQITGGSITNITDIAVADGGTGSSTASGARSNLGLGNVDNTSDANKPISAATQTALDTLTTTIMNRGPKFIWQSGETAAALTTRAQNFFNAAIAYGGGDWAAGEYALNCGLTINGDAEINFSENAGINFDNSTVIADGIIIGADTITMLPAITANILKNSDTVTFASAPTISPGDWVVFWLDATASWMSTTIAGSNRPYYKSGEYKRVWSVSGNTVQFDTAFLYDYAYLDLSIARVPTNKIKLTGGRFSGLYNASSDRSIIICNNLEDSFIQIRATHGQRALLDLRRCFETYANVRGHDYGPSVSLNYGISAVACHKLSLTGSMRTRRHAISITGGGISAPVPNREVVFRDGFLAGSSMAFDCHGAADGVGIEDSFIDGGAVFGGDKTFIRNCEITPSLGSEDLGVAIKFRERKGMSHTIENCKIRVNQAASGGKFLVHLQGDTTSDTPAVHDFGGTVRIAGLTIVSDITTAISNGITVRGGSNQRVDLDISGIKYVTAATQTCTQLRFDTTSVPAYTSVTVRDCDDVAIRSYASFKARRITLDSIRCSLSPNNGIYLALGTPDTRTDISIINPQIDSSQDAGIRILGTANTDPIFFVLNGGYSINNSQNASTTSNYKSGLVLININNAIVNSFAVGDDQATQTQLRRMTFEACNNVLVNTATTISTNLTTGYRSDLLVNMDASAIRFIGRPNKTLEVGDANSGAVTVMAAAIARWSTDLTANRTGSTSDAGAGEGDELRFERPAGGAFTLTINSTITVAAGTGILMRKLGTAGWYLAQRYSLT